MNIKLVLRHRTAKNLYKINACYLCSIAHRIIPNKQVLPVPFDRSLIDYDSIMEMAQLE
jgi:hypothetical protein